MHDQITPVLLTRDESANITRTLHQLTWARRVVVVDSLSTDDTPRLAKHFPNVCLFQRAFDSHEAQWNYALQHTHIDTQWVLALDADYVLSDALVVELATLVDSYRFAGYRASFRYCVHGIPLRGSLYPPVTVLFRHSGAVYRQDGHTQRVVIPGTIGSLESPIFHDDRKSLSRWLSSQDAYMKREAEHLCATGWPLLSWRNRARRLLLGPLLVAPLGLFGKGLLLDGHAGLHYCLQRTLAETLLALRLVDSTIQSSHSKRVTKKSADGS